MSDVSSPEAVPSEPPSRVSRVGGTLRRFWQGVSDGLEMQQLWDQFHAETRASYELFRKEVRWESDPSEKRFARGARIARELFWAFLKKLSPSRRIVLLVAIVAAWLGMIRFSFGHTSLELDIRALGFVLLLVLLGLELADRVTMKRDLEIARDIQRWLLPANPPQVPGLEIAFTTRPANTVAGDYYDAFIRNSGERQLVLAVADVAGKSVPAALLMATFQASLQSVAAECDGPLELVERLNQFACSRSLDGKRFTTAFLAELNLDTRTLRYVNAGHNAPVLRRCDGPTERLELGGIPLGIDREARYETGETQLEAGDFLLVFTDGLVEAVDTSGNEYGDERLIDDIRALSGRTAAETIPALFEGVGRFSAGTRQYDDMTCLAVRME